jgi:hypothetical protein
MGSGPVTIKPVGSTVGEISGSFDVTLYTASDGFCDKRAGKDLSVSAFCGQHSYLLEHDRGWELGFTFREKLFEQVQSFPDTVVDVIQALFKSVFRECIHRDSS